MCFRTNPDKLFEVFFEIGRPQQEGEGTASQIITNYSQSHLSSRIKGNRLKVL